MTLFSKRLVWFFLFALVFPLITFAADSNTRIPILCYHNFNPVKPGSMNLTPQKLESQIKWLKDNGFNIIPLKDAVAWLEGKQDSLPENAVVITVDDGWASAYHYLLPIVKKYHIPVTLFIYPETISEGQNAMTWDELKEMQATGYFDIQGHTLWHPNFKQEKKHLTPEKYDEFVKKQLVNSKKILEEKMGKPVDYLAWPFGIYDANLEEQAKNAGYKMAFTIDARPASRKDRPMAQPRYMIIDGLSAKTFYSIANTAKSPSKVIQAKS